MLLIGAFSAAVAQNQEKTREIKLYINGYSYREWAPKNTSYIQDQIKDLVLDAFHWLCKPKKAALVA